jgi:putative transposase
MQRSVPLAVGETYHVYNRGAHKSKIFTSSPDYERMLLLLYLCNSSLPLNLRDVLSNNKGRSFADIFMSPGLRGEDSSRLVDILAYCLMPNHYHLVVRQRTDQGISTFIKKIGTAYSMYFNTKYEHSGTLFQGRFKSSHIDTEAYFRYIFAYVHLNPLELVEPGWDTKGVSNRKKAEKFMDEYPYSSFLDYSQSTRPENSILSRESEPGFLTSQNDLEELLATFTKDRPL